MLVFGSVIAFGYLRNISNLAWFVFALFTASAVSNTEKVDDLDAALWVGGLQPVYPNLVNGSGMQKPNWKVVFKKTKNKLAFSISNNTLSSSFWLPSRSILFVFFLISQETTPRENHFLRTNLDPQVLWELPCGFCSVFFKRKFPKINLLGGSSHLKDGFHNRSKSPQ